MKVWQGLRLAGNETPLKMVTAWNCLGWPESWQGVKAQVGFHMETEGKSNQKAWIPREKKAAWK